MGAVFSPIVHPFSKPLHRTIPKSVAVIGGGAPATPFIITPSTETPVAGVDTTWTTNAGDLGTPVSYSWDFGDGTIPVTGATPSHYFVGPGPYTVTCVVTYDDDSTDTDTQVITLQTTEVLTLLNKPYQDGTALPAASDAYWTKYTLSTTADYAAAPDGTTTATLIDEGAASGTPNFQRTYTGVTAGADYTFVCYAKYIDLRYFVVDIYSTHVSAVVFDLQSGVIAGGQASANRLLGSSMQAVPGATGWYRLSVSFRAEATTIYPILCTANSATLDNDGVPASYTGTNRQLLFWGPQMIAGVDDFSTRTHYLGAVQSPAPTSTVNVLRASDGHTLTHMVDFSLGDLTDSNYNTTYDFDAKAGTIDGPVFPVGGKLQSDATVGYHTRGYGFNWAVGYSIGKPKLNGVVTQVGLWIYLEEAPATYIRPITFSASGTYQGFSINSDLSVTSRDISAAEGTTMFAGPLPLKEWFYLGMGQVGLNKKLVLRTRSGSSWADSFSSITTESSANFELDNDLLVGFWHTAGNANYYTRFTGATYHQLDSLDQLGYPSEIVPPQIGNHIYNANADTGDDTNDGVTAPWQTVDKVSAMFGTNGVIEEYTAGTVGSGNWLVIDTSTEQFVTTDIPIFLRRAGTWLKPPVGETVVDIKSYVEVASGDWAATGGYSNIYQIACDEPEITTVFGDNVLFANEITEAAITSLAALNAAAGGASWLDTTGNILYIKPLALTNPATDGITYIYGRHRTKGDTVGYPVVSVAAADCRVTGCKIWYTADNGNGNYAVGEITGFSGKLLVENCDSKYSDKHGICFTINATGSQIDIVNCEASLSYTYPFTSFMFSGSGNVHNYTECTSDVAILLKRSAVGTPNITHGNGPGAFYMHGSGGTFTEVNFTDCVFGGSIEAEVAHNEINVVGGSVQFVRGGNTVNLDTVTLRDVIPINGTVTGLTVVTGNSYSTVWDMQGSLTNSTFDLRTLAAQAIGLWTLTGATTFTGNTIRFAAGQSSPIIKNSAATDIVAWNNNTYYIEAAAVFAKDFDAGGGAADYTFAQWQALGYDVNSTRYDPT